MTMSWSEIPGTLAVDLTTDGLVVKKGFRRFSSRVGLERT